MKESSQPYVMIVDDHIANSKAAAAMLARKGLRAVMANSVLQAMTLCIPDMLGVSERTPSWILMKEIMPGFNGFDFCKNLLPAMKSEVKVLVMSECEGLFNKEGPHSSGAVAVIPYPLTEDVLIKAMERHLTSEMTAHLEKLEFEGIGSGMEKVRKKI